MKWPWRRTTKVRPDEQTLPTFVRFNDGGSVGIGLDWDETCRVVEQMPDADGEEWVIAAHRLAEYRAKAYLWERWSRGDSVLAGLDKKHALQWRANDEEDEG